MPNVGGAIASFPEHCVGVAGWGVVAGGGGGRGEGGGGGGGGVGVGLGREDLIHDSLGCCPPSTARYLGPKRFSTSPL